MNIYKQLVPIVILISILSVLYYYTIPQENPTKEGFVAETPSNADDSDIQISMCPQGSTPLQTKNGDTDCCDGEIVDFKCRKKLVCTLSPAHDGIPSCVDFMKRYLRDKAVTNCPSKFPRYWENQATKQKGCVAGKRLPDGTGPKDSPTFENSCKIQTTEQENRNTYGSCYNTKYNETLNCPERAGLGSQRGYHGAWWAGSVDKVPNLHFCRPVNEMPTYDLCYDDATLKLWWDALWPGWRGWLSANPWWKANICSIYKQLRIDKTITDAQLKDIEFS